MDKPLRAISRQRTGGTFVAILILSALTLKRNNSKYKQFVYNILHYMKYMLVGILGLLFNLNSMKHLAISANISKCFFYINNLIWHMLYVVLRSLKFVCLEDAYFNTFLALTLK